MSVSQAATLACFEFTGGSFAVTTELPQTAGSAGNVALGSSWSVNATGGLDQDSAIASTGISASENIISFTYTVTGLNAGETLNITDASMDFSGTTNTIRFNYLVDGSVIGSNFNPPGSGTYSDALPGTSGATVTGLGNGDSITLGFSSRDNGGNGITVDNFKLNGDIIPVPEPSSTLLLGLGFGGLLFRRRR